MPVEVAIWKLGEKVTMISFEPMPSESRLEDILAQDIFILDPKLLLIGRQVLTGYGKFIDLLAMDADGNLVVVELKRDKTPRDIVAQVLDYGSWVRTLEDEDIASVFADYVAKYYPEEAATSLDQAFCDRFKVGKMPEALNESHELVIVAGELDDSTERIVSYLADEYGVAVNAVFFRFFRDGGNEYLSRVWLIEPGEVPEPRKGEWNGEFYVSFGEGVHRNWADARKYGFVSAGGGAWYTQTLKMLEAGSRIWVNVPGQGYVGVGRATASVVPLSDFTVNDDSGQQLAIAEAKTEAPLIHDPNRAEGDQEQFVRVAWDHAVPLREAVREKGFFGNQNTVAKPRDKKWSHTVERLKKRFGVTE